MTISAKNKAVWQHNSLIKEIKSQCTQGHWLMRSNNPDIDIKTKKFLYFSPANPSYNNEHRG